MSPGSTSLPPTTALAATPSTSTDNHHDEDSDTHDDCPFRQLLSVRPASCTPRPRPSGAGRGGRLKEERGSGKSVRFADTVTGPDGSPFTPGAGRGDAATPYRTGVVNMGKFYRRSDGRFVTRGGGRRPATAKERAPPVPPRPPLTAQYSHKPGQHQLLNTSYECHKKCPFRELLNNRPHKSVPKSWRSLSEGRPRLVGEGPKRPGMRVSGVSAPRWEHGGGKLNAGASLGLGKAPQGTRDGAEEVDARDIKLPVTYKNISLYVVAWPKLEAVRKNSPRTRSSSCPINATTAPKSRPRTRSAPAGTTWAPTAAPTRCTSATTRSASLTDDAYTGTPADTSECGAGDTSPSASREQSGTKTTTRFSLSPKTWPFCTPKAHSHHGVGCKYVSFPVIPKLWISLGGLLQITDSQNLKHRAVYDSKLRAGGK